MLRNRQIAVYPSAGKAAQRELHVCTASDIGVRCRGSQVVTGAAPSHDIFGRAMAMMARQPGAAQDVQMVAALAAVGMCDMLTDCPRPAPRI